MDGRAERQLRCPHKRLVDMALNFRHFRHWLNEVNITSRVHYVALENTHKLCIMLLDILRRPHHVNVINWMFSHKADFLLSVGDAMTMTEYWHVDVFRPGL